MLLVPPSADIKRKIEEYLYQDPDITATDIKHLREWIAKQPHLPQDHDDIWLERFLYGCKYSVERCKKVLDRFYTQRTNIPQYFNNVDPTSEDIRQISSVYYTFFLPKCTPDGYRVAVKGVLDGDASKFDFNIVVQKEMLFYNSYMKMEPNYGLILIYDTKLFNVHQLARIVPHFHNISHIAQDSIPFRLKQVHFLYASSTAKTLVSTLFPLLKEKIRNRVHVHTSDLTTLYEFIPQEILPNEFGGEAGTIKELNDSWQEQVESMREWLLEEYKKKTDETKRPEDSRTNELFGIDGSFKKLNVD